MDHRLEGAEEKEEDGDIEKRTLGMRRPVNAECKEAKQELTRPKGRPRRGV